MVKQPIDATQTTGLAFQLKLAEIYNLSSPVPAGRGSRSDVAYTLLILNQTAPSTTVGKRIGPIILAINCRKRRSAEKPPAPWNGTTVVSLPFPPQQTCSPQGQPFFAYFLLAWTKSRAAGGPRPAGVAFYLKRPARPNPPHRFAKPSYLPEACDSYGADGAGD